MYHITEYTYKKAKQLGVQVFPSKNKNKKIDVFKDGVKLCSIGSLKYLDYPNYVLTKGREFADKRRALYKKRHEKDRHIIGSAGYYADMLW